MKPIDIKAWTDWVDYWAADFDYLQRKEIIKVAVGTGLGGFAVLPGFEAPQGELALPEFEERCGPAATSSKTNGRAFARARTANWS